MMIMTTTMTTDNGQILIRKSHLSLWLRRAKNMYKTCKNEHMCIFKMSEIKAYLNFHFIFLIFSYLTILSTAFFPSMNPLGMQFGQRISYLWRNSWKRILFGKPCLQILIPSNTPLHLSCSRTSGESIFPALRRTNSEKC